MLHIILLILKIIGITVLALIGLILLILLTILLVPIRYRVDALYNDTIKLEGRIGWLCNINGARLSYLEGEIHIRVRILWFTLYDNLKPKLKRVKKRRSKNVAKSKKKKKSQARTTKKTAPNINPSKTEQKSDSKENQTKSENISADVILSDEKRLTTKLDEKLNKKLDKKLDKKQITIDDTIKDSMEHEQLSLENDTSTEEEQLSFFQKIVAKIKSIIDRIKSIKTKIISFFQRVKRKIIELFETISDIKNKIGMISEFIKNEMNKEGFRVTFASIKRLLKHILPTRVRAKIIFGTGDPCSTGQVLGLMGILYSLYGNKIAIIPDFENKRFEGEIHASGRIRMITILIIVIKLILDKKFKQLKENFLILKEAL